MILREELEEISKAKGLSPKNTEKDYILDIFLLGISKYRNDLVFKGGTALYKFYNLNRFSEDLDFTLNKKKMDFDKLTSDLLRNTDVLGIPGNGTGIEEYRNAVNIKIDLRGPLFNGSRGSITRVALNISTRERPQHPRAMFYTPVYREMPSFELYVMDAGELMAEKIRAIMTREKPRDVFDLWFLLQRGAEAERGLVNKKLKIYKTVFDPETFERAVENKRKMWKRDLGGLLIGGGLPGFEDVRKEIMDRVVP